MRIRLIHKGLIFIPMYKRDLELESILKKHGYEFLEVN